MRVVTTIIYVIILKLYIIYIGSCHRGFAPHPYSDQGYEIEFIDTIPLLLSHTLKKNLKIIIISYMSHHEFFKLN